jgi:hypothetical protein
VDMSTGVLDKERAGSPNNGQISSIASNLVDASSIPTSTSRFRVASPKSPNFTLLSESKNLLDDFKFLMGDIVRLAGAICSTTSVQHIVSYHHLPMNNIMIM